MSLFGANKASHGTVQEVAHMIEHYFKGRNLNPHEHQIAGAEGYGFWLTEGTAKIYIFVQDTNIGPVLRITSPMVYVPTANREAFYRRCLEINTDLSSCALSIANDVVLVVAQRPTKALDQEELDDIVWNVAYVADLLDNKFITEFNARIYQEG